LPVLDSTPYPWPYDDPDGLDPARGALVLTGVQRCWAALDTTDVLDRITALASALRDVGVLVVHVRHARTGTAVRPGADLPLVTDLSAALLLAPAPTDLVIEATTHDGFLDTPIDAELRARRRDHLLFAGLAAETVLDSTLRSANDRGYECVTLTDAAAPFDPKIGARALSSITMSGGIFGAIATTHGVAVAYGVTP
jgi:nicotinamidase-related amidase